MLIFVVNSKNLQRTERKLTYVIQETSSLDFYWYHTHNKKKNSACLIPAIQKGEIT